jgi:hypothetical protein
MRTHLKSAAAVLILATGPVAQSLEVVPRLARAWDTHERDPYFFHRDPARTQWIYDVDELTLTQATLRSVAFRSGGSLQVQATTVTGALDISTSPLSTTQVTTTFASNRGANATRVFQGTISLPGQAGNWPRPWTPAVAFAQPFAYVRGPNVRTLVVEFEKSSVNSSNETWLMERYSVAPGEKRAALTQSNCYGSTGTQSVGWGHAPWEPVPGGTMSLTFFEFPNNVPSYNASVLLIGLNGPGSLFAGSIPMPFEPYRYGIPSPRFCQLAVEPLVTMPMSYVVRSNQGQLEIRGLQIPDQPSLYNRRFFVQGLGVDTHPILSTPVLVPTVALEVRIGSGEVARGKTVYAPPASAQGTLFHGVGALQLGW